MTTTERHERPEKQVLHLHCEHPSTVVCECRAAALVEVLTRWPPTPTAAPGEQPDRVRVDLGEIRAPLVRPYQRPEPLVITDDDERHGDSLLGAAGAWACVAISVLLLLAIAARQLWLWV